MALRFLRISPDVPCIRHQDWENLNLSFRCIVYNGNKFVRVEGSVEDGLDWYNYVSAIPGVEVTVLTQEQLQTAKDIREKLSLEEEIPRLRAEVAVAEARYVELGGDLGDIL